jgi:hypothetical protein
MAKPRPERVTSGRRADATPSRSRVGSAPSGDRGPGLAADPAAERAALALWGALALLVALRAVFSFVPSMDACSLNLQRHLPPLPGWGLWALAVAALIPPLARRLVAPLARVGDAFSRAPLLATLAWMTGAALLVWALPDRVRFVGDFLLRQGSVEELVTTSRVFPQALPLDALLHYQLPALVADRGWLDPNGAARLLGALEAAALAACAVGFARTLGARGIAAAATTAVVTFGGTLGLFTGYGKAFSEMAVLTAVIAVLGLSTARTGHGFVPLGLALALGALLHRSALGFVPAAAVAFTLGWRAAADPRHGDPIGARVLGLALPIGAFAAMAPRILHTLRTADATVHFASAEVQRSGGLLGAMFAGTRPSDMLNLLVLLAPVAPAAAVMALAWRRLPGRREGAVLGALALPFVVFVLLVHPANGLFRDWDDFAAAGVAVSLIAAWLVAGVLGRAPRHAWVGVAVVFAAAVPAVQWLAHHADLARGLRRVEAFATEPPRRSESERGNTWDYLGVRAFRFERWGASADAFGRAAELAPSPRILTQWAMAETQRGDLARAVEVYRRVIARDSTSFVAWHGIAAVASRLGRFDESRAAALRMQALDPGNAEAAAIIEYLDRQPRSTPEGAVAR